MKEIQMRQQHNPFYKYIINYWIFISKIIIFRRLIHFYIILSILLMLYKKNYIL